MSVKIDLNHKIHVLTKKEELDGVRVPGKVVVVLDILFATTTMVTALAHGATEVIPVLDEAAARAESERYGDCVVAGELYAETIAGFAHPAPLALLKHGIRGKTVVYSTTNGTVAMTQAAGAARGLREEVEFACRFDALPVVPALEQGRLRLVSGSARSRSG